MSYTLDKLVTSSASELASVVREAPHSHMGAVALRNLELRAERWAHINAAASDEHSAADLAATVYQHTIESFNGRAVPTS